MPSGGEIVKEAAVAHATAEIVVAYLNSVSTRQFDIQNDNEIYGHLIGLIKDVATTLKENI